MRTFMLVLFALFYMVIIGLNPLSDLVKTIPATGEGDFARQLCYSLIFLVTLVASQPIPHFGKLLTLPMSVTLALGYCWLSLTWSIAPDVGMRRLVLTSIIIFTVFRSVEEVGYARAISVVRVVLLLTLILNYVSIQVTPAAIHQIPEDGDTSLVGDWRGILPQKNFAGAICAFTILAFTFDAGKLKPIFRYAVILATSYFLYRTVSKTSMGLTVVSIAIGAAYMRYNPAYRALLIPSLAIIGSAVILYVDRNWTSIVAPLNSPDALTGRVQIWPPLLAYANDHWMLGSGYGSFWNTGPSSPIYQYAKGWVSILASGHNGYIDLLTQIGYPGLALIVVTVIIIPLFRILLSTVAPRPQGALLISLLIFCAGHNFTESSLFDRDMIVQLFLMFTVAMIYGVTGAPAFLRRGSKSVGARKDFAQPAALAARTPTGRTFAAGLHATGGTLPKGETR